jgi:NadR type nicotinamide-nucleotide adenylyltransferase
MKRVCLHGPESTGKSTLAAALAAHYGAALIDEYGRDYCEIHGTDLDMADLLTIAQTHAQMISAAMHRGGTLLILDTDPLMTAVWADMMCGQRDPWFDKFSDVADLYLMPDIDLPWVDDGLRVYGADGERARFFALSRAELDRRGVDYAIIGGTGDARLAAAIAEIERRFS